MDSKLFDKFYKSIIPKSCFRRAISMAKGENATSLFLLYSGEMEYLYREKGSIAYRSVLKIGKGTLFGFESLEEEGKYEYSVRTVSDRAIYFEIPINALEPVKEYNIGFLEAKSKKVGEIIEKFKKQFKQQKKRMSEFSENYDREKMIKGLKKKQQPKLRISIKKTFLSKQPSSVKSRKTVNIPKVPYLDSMRLNPDSPRVPEGSLSQRIRTITGNVKLSSFWLDCSRAESERRNNGKEPSFELIKEVEQPKPKKERYVHRDVYDCVKEFKKKSFCSGKFTFPLISGLK